MTIKELKDALHILDERLPVIFFHNGYKTDVKLTLTNKALLVSANDVPKPSVDSALDE